MVELIVDNEPLDLLEDVIMSFQVSDIANIDDRQGDFSYEFTLPATQKNRRLLKRAHIIYGSPYQFINAWLRSKADIKKGFLQVMEYNGQFRSNFFAGNANWIALIGDKLLSECNLSGYDDTYSKANIKASWSATEGVIYPLMNAKSGQDRAVWVGDAAVVRYELIDGYIDFEDLSGSYFTTDKWESPYYTADDDYSVSVHAFIDATLTGSPSGNFQLWHNGVSVVSKSFSTHRNLRIRLDLKKGDTIAVRVVLTAPTLGKYVDVQTTSFLRIDTGLVALARMNYNDFFPAVYVHTIIKQIFQDINFKLAGTFLDNPDYKKLIIPFTGTTFAFPDDVVTDRSIKMGLIDPLTVSGATYIDWDKDTGAYFNGGLYASTKYTADEDYTVTVEVFLKISNDTSSSTTCELILNAATVLDSYVETGESTVVLEAIDYVLTAGDYLRVKVTPASGSLDLGVISYFKVTANSIVSPGDKIITRLLMPEMRQIDLIKYIFVSFGVIPVVDDFSLTLTLTEFRRVKQNTPEDWSEKLAGDYDLDFYQFASNYAKINYFKYAEADEDKDLKNYISKNKKGFGDGDIHLTNVFLTGETDLVSTDFVPSWMDRFTLDLYISHLVTFTRDKNPRILFVIPDALVEDFSESGFASFELDEDSISLTNVAWAYFSKYGLGTDLDNYTTQLSYSLPYLANGNPFPGIGLLAKYWLDYAGILDRPKMLIVPMKLSIKDIINLDYTRRKYILAENITGYYFLNKIEDYDFNNGIAKCQLMLTDNLDLSEKTTITPLRDSDFLLLETGDYYLLETGDKIKLE